MTMTCRAELKTTYELREAFSENLRRSNAQLLYLAKKTKDLGMCCFRFVVVVVPFQLCHADSGMEKVELQYKNAKERVDTLDSDRLSMLRKRKEQQKIVQNVKDKNEEGVSSQSSQCLFV